jgi:hypothetical protein
MRDGSRPPAVGLQELIANYPKRLGLRVLVVSVREKVLRSIMCEPRRRIPMNHCPSVEREIDGIKNEGLMLPRDKSDGDLFTGQTVPGIEVARSRFGLSC